MLNFMWVLRQAFSVLWPMRVGSKAKGNASYMWSTKIYWDLKSKQIYTRWTDRVVRKCDLCQKAPPWNIFLMWEQTGRGGEERRYKQTPLTWTPVVYPAASSRSISTEKKCVEWWGHRAGLFRGGKELSHWTISRQTDLSTGEKSNAGRRRHSWKTHSLHSGIEILFFFFLEKRLRHC